MPLFRVELCYTVPHYLEMDVDAEDAEHACDVAMKSHDADGFEPCLEASGDTFVSDCVEGDWDRVAHATLDAHRPVHRDYRSDEANTAAACDKLYAFAETVARLALSAERKPADPDDASLTLDALIARARAFTGERPG